MSFLSCVCSSWGSVSPAEGLWAAFPSPTCIPVFLPSLTSVGCKVWDNLLPMQTSEARVGFEQYWWHCFRILCGILMCWLLAQSPLLTEIWLGKASAKITTGVLTTHPICVTDVRGFISFEICPREEWVTNEPMHQPGHDTNLLIVQSRSHEML